MRVLVAFDKFKDSLTAPRACAVAAEAIASARGGWQLDECPLSDGGEGFAGDTDPRRRRDGFAASR